MLAAHRDQENLVQHHHAPTKQNPKTPGGRYPKTPGNMGRNDENAPTAFGRKTVLGGVKMGANDKIMAGKATGQRQAMVTPIDNRGRAPLGNKTTNAKARTGQTVGVKDMVREIEKSHTKQSGGEKPKQRQAQLQSTKLSIQHDKSDSTDDQSVPEPEYAPPRPTSLPYESDVLPPGGLTFNGLKKGNLLRGYYQQFHNPVDQNGLSRMENNFNKEMEMVFRKAEQRTSEEMEAINWSAEDMEEYQVSDFITGEKSKQSGVATPRRPGRVASEKQPATVSARRAASALAVHSDLQNRAASRPGSRSSGSRRPLSSMISGTRPAKPIVTKPCSTGNSSGEAASRTTLGYNKGRSASSMLHSRGNGQSVKERQQPKPTAVLDFNSELTITPARIRQATSCNTKPSRPQFMSIFEEDDDEDLPEMQAPFLTSDDDEDEFELKLTI